MVGTVRRATLNIPALVLFFSFPAFAEQESVIPPAVKKCRITRKPGKRIVGTLVDDTLTQLWRNVADINREILSWDSFKIMVSIFPFFIATRMIDEKLQNCFYDSRYHRNKNQIPSSIYHFAEKSIAIPIVVLGSRAFISEDFEQQKTAQIFLTGMPFVIWGKDLIKKLDFDICYRPWHEKYSCKKRSYGGFPSGHMAEAVYTAVLYGLQFGPAYAIPLGLLASFIGVTFLVNNRHYASQLFAGAGLGAMYALAGHKVVNSRVAEHCSVGLQTLPGGAAVNVSFKF